jgi:hypothetical protein
MFVGYSLLFEGDDPLLYLSLPYGEVLFFFKNYLIKQLAWTVIFFFWCIWPDVFGKPALISARTC